MAIVPHNALKAASDTQGGARQCVDLVGNGRRLYGAPTQRRRLAPPGRDAEMSPTSPPPGVITTRTLGPMLTVEQGTVVVARIHRVGQVQAAFGKDI